MAEARRTLYLVDGSGYVFRAFFALPQLNNSRGMPTNAVYGFIRMLMKLLKDARPTHIAVVFDAPTKTFRDDLFQDYKANRVETPNDLVRQIPYIHRAVDAFKIPRLVIDGYEADDVIGTLAVKGARDSFDTVIVTGDKDFMQLVGPHITLWDTMKDERVAARQVKEKLGVDPALVIDLMALTGDAIDNIRGIPGVGEKKASALIQHFGSLEKVFANLDRLREVPGIGPKLVAAISAHRADAELARKLVTIATDAPLQLQPDDFAWSGADHDALIALMRELEFGSLVAELAPATVAAPPAAEITEVRIDEQRLPALLDDLRAADRLSLHLGGDAAGAIVLKLKAAGRPALYTLARDLLPRARELLAAPRPAKACHDVKRHLNLLRRYGVALDGVQFDTMLAGFLINPGKPEPALDDLYHEHLAPLGGPAAPGAEPLAVEALWDTLATALDRNQLVRQFSEIELPVAKVLAEMEATGIGIDASALKQMSAEFGRELAQLESECFRLAGREFNLNSPLQLRDILFNDLKLPTKGLKKTKSGFSTDADALEKLAAAHPLPRKLLEYRALAKLKSTYCDALPELIDPATGRLHTSFHQALTATGRLSSTEPNLQNIPTRTEEGRRIRRAFVADPGRILISADYSQIELRVLAHLSDDPTLVEAFARGEDIHARTAADVLGAAKDDREARRLAKVINFGIIYGMGPQRLAAELEIPLAEAQAYIKRYFERMPGVKSYFDQTLRDARERGYVTTMFGRRRYLPELNGPDGGARAQAERIAINTPIQGTAADLIKLAMVRLAAMLSAASIRAKMVLQVHDELLIEADRDAAAAAATAIRSAMEDVAQLKVPLMVDLKAGSNWAEMLPLTPTA